MHTQSTSLKTSVCTIHVIKTVPVCVSSLSYTYTHTEAWAKTVGQKLLITGGRTREAPYWLSDMYLIHLAPYLEMARDGIEWYPICSLYQMPPSTCVYVCISIYICACVYVCVDFYASVSFHVSVSVCVCPFVCVCVCACVDIAAQPRTVKQRA